MKKLMILTGLVGAILAGCAQEEKVDDRFNKAFEQQGKRMQGQAPTGNDGASHGQALPPGTTPPPSGSN